MARITFVAAMLVSLSSPGASADDGGTSFSHLAALVGTWRVADRPDSPLRIHFELTAGGTVLLERWERAGRPHSLTIYHRDGDLLVATHYCPQGNQPRLAHKAEAASTDGTGSVLDFRFVGVSDLDPGESYLRGPRFELAGLGRVIRKEVYRGSKGDEESTLLLAPAEPSP